MDVDRAVVFPLGIVEHDYLEPTLTRHGYKMRDLSEELGVKSREIKSLFHNQLEPGRSKELLEKMLAAGLSI